VPTTQPGTPATDELGASATRSRGLSLRPGGCGSGRPEGLGTHNRIVPLGGGYLEILAVAAAGEAARSQLGRALDARVARAGEGLMGGAVAVGDVVPSPSDSPRR
jgi:hypothetical protein